MSNDRSSRARVLVVDDDAAVMRVTARLLRADFEVASAASAAEAVALLDRERFDLIVTDNDMPGGDGLSLLVRVRESAPHMRRVLLSGGTPHDLDGHIRSGLVERFLAKPAAPVDLRRALAELGLQP